MDEMVVKTTDFIPSWFFSDEHQRSMAVGRLMPSIATKSWLVTSRVPKMPYSAVVRVLV